MANHELTVIRADGATRTLWSADVSGLFIQGALVSELPVAICVPTGGISRYQVDPSPVVALDPPNDTPRYALIRVWEPSHLTNPSKRLYFREDGVNPSANGSDAHDFLCHRDSYLSRIADFTNFRMVADSTDAGVFEVFVTWLKISIV